MNTLKHLAQVPGIIFIILSISISAQAAPKNEVIVDNSRAKNHDIVSVEIRGGKGSKAEKIYNALTNIEEVSDNAMGSRYGMAKQGQGVACFIEEDARIKSSYVCAFKINTAGDSLQPWR